MTYSPSGSYSSRGLEGAVNRGYSSMSFSPFMSRASASYSLNQFAADSPLENTLSDSYTVNLDRSPEFISPYNGSKDTETDEKYSTSSNNQGYHMNQTPEQHHVFIDSFLDPNRPATQFVDDATEIEEHVKETFEKLTSKVFPSNITIELCTSEELKKHHNDFGGKWSDGIQGFSINRPQGVSNVFVKKSELDRVMLVVGHEIGHVVTPTLGNAQDEEAKAFAFELAWIRTIKENNIADLQSCFTLEPAKNGVHDVAFDFVRKMSSLGKKASVIFEKLAEGSFSVHKELTPMSQ